MHDRIKKLEPFRLKIESKLKRYMLANQFLWAVMLCFPFLYVYALGYLPFAYNVTMWSAMFAIVAFSAVRTLYKVLDRNLRLPTKGTYDLKVIEFIPSYRDHVKQAQALVKLCARSYGITKPVELRVMDETVLGVNGHSLEKYDHIEIAMSEEAFKLNVNDMQCLLMHEFAHVYNQDSWQMTKVKKFQIIMYALTICHVGVISPGLITSAMFILPMIALYLFAARMHRKGMQQIEYLADLNAVTYGPTPVVYSACLRHIINPDFFNNRVYRERLEKFDRLFVLSHPLTSLRVLECERYQKELDLR